MSGYFERAPLVYVVAKVTASDLPRLLDEQVIQLEQAMFECDLIHKAYLTVPAIVFGQSELPEQTNVSRKCYLSSSRSEALVVDVNSIEFRVTDYRNYKTFKERFSIILDKLISVMKPWHNVRVKEISLSFVDVIIPQQHELPKYFSESFSLPLDSQKDSLGSDVVQLGKLEWQRIVDGKLKVQVSVDQLSNHVRKFIPDSLLEPSDKFAQPLSLNGNIDECNGSHYAILMTKTSTLPDDETKFESFTVEAFDRAHEQDRLTFKSMINLPLCKDEWGYRESSD